MPSPPGHPGRRLAALAVVRAGAPKRVGSLSVEDQDADVLDRGPAAFADGTAGVDSTVYGFGDRKG